MEKELKILTATVTIQLVTVDGKRMTKAVFNQIQEETPFDKDLNFTGDSLLGYIVDNGKCLLWIKNGELRKTYLNKLTTFIKATGESYLFEVRDICRICAMKKDQVYPDWELVKNWFNAEEITQLHNLQKRASEFLQKLEGSQLYIAI